MSCRIRSGRVVTRYSNQYTQSDCGPVAALNILKWAGMKVTYKYHVRHIKEECDYVHNEDFSGVRWWNLRSGLSRIGKGKIKVRKLEVRSLEDLQKHIAKGGAFILRFRAPPRHYHYTTVVPSDDGKDFVWVNPNDKLRTITLHPEEFEKKIMSKQRFGDNLVALLISKI